MVIMKIMVVNNTLFVKMPELSLAPAIPVLSADAIMCRAKHLSKEQGENG